ncbi:MAG TPA: twin-arginine translocase TatA/TatE family subunit [Pirellulales bacterium]|nr:twin-arginine translocase TatA/TatE family subunit [Pirellulales bacterium]
MFGLGPMEMLIVGVIAVLLFGNRLPEVGRSLGKGLVEFKKGLRDIQNEVNIADNSSSSSAPSTSRVSHQLDERDEATAPKFVPPTHEPTPAPGVAASTPPLSTPPADHPTV